MLQLLTAFVHKLFSQHHLEQYLGMNIEKYQIAGNNTGHEYWSMSPRQYVQEVGMQHKGITKGRGQDSEVKGKDAIP